MSHGQAWPCTSQGHSALLEAGGSQTLGSSLRRLPGASCLAGKGLCDQNFQGKQLWESQAPHELREQGARFLPPFRGHAGSSRWGDQGLQERRVLTKRCSVERDDKREHRHQYKRQDGGTAHGKASRQGALLPPARRKRPGRDLNLRTAQVRSLDSQSQPRGRLLD